MPIVKPGLAYRLPGLVFIQFVSVVLDVSAFVLSRIGTLVNRFIYLSLHFSVSFFF